MLYQDLGIETTIIMGIAIGFVGYAILTFWVGLIWKDFQYSNWYWRFFWVHLIFWVVAMCIVPTDSFNDIGSEWGGSLLNFYLVSLVFMGISKIRKMK